MSRTNLNDLRIPHADLESVPMADFGISTPWVDVHFRNLADRLIDEINKADYVVGCVAWLTHYGILDALAARRGVSLIVQKEDWLRPDRDVTKRGLRARYEFLPSMDRLDHRGIVGNLSVCSDPTLEAVRCCGSLGPGKAASAPRCHHKFAVFCQHETDPTIEVGHYGHVVIRPYAVWTGSFNFTHNASVSFENAVVIRTHEAVSAYYSEWQQVVALSEPLDWQAEWVAPEWRIGT